MMEFAFSVAEKAIEKQWSLTYKEISSDLNKLKPHMSAIQAVLQDAEKKQVKNEGLIDWLGQVKDVFYDAEDVRDEFKCEALRRQVREMTHSFVHDSYVIGRDEDKEKIIDLLMHPSEDGTVPVISIVGIGGMGKTTLAQWVYNDERCPGLESFPEGIQRLTALRRLDFSRCESLISLPQGLKHLTALEKPGHLGCGELSKNCEREVGVEWPKIKHIPQIEITQ
uniref:Rx N-terminal domain-containing protein n=1 Tax=Fagus sylvatica TaxID=28930 RepID=A0A2N9H2W4_FAGSY